MHGGATLANPCLLVNHWRWDDCKDMPNDQMKMLLGHLHYPMLLFLLAQRKLACEELSKHTCEHCLEMPTGTQ